MEQLNFSFGDSGHGFEERTERHGRDVDAGMVHARVFHSANDLEDQAAFGNDFEKVFHGRLSEVEGLVPGINSEAGDLEYFVAAPNVFLPAWPGEVDGAERDQEAEAMFAAGARRVRMSTLGFLHNLTPSITLIVAVTQLGESFTPLDAMSFGCIWTALILVSLEAPLSRLVRAS